MQITNEQAMQRLAEIKAKERAISGASVGDFTARAYYSGLHIGLAEAYQQAGVISWEQYEQVTAPVRLAA